MTSAMFVLNDSSVGVLEYPALKQPIQSKGLKESRLYPTIHYSLRHLRQEVELIVVIIWLHSISLSVMQRAS